MAEEALSSSKLLAQPCPNILNTAVNEKPDHHESREKTPSIFKKTSSLVPPSPSRTRKTKEDSNQLTDSSISIPAEKPGEREDRKHSFLQLFSRKHQPSTLEGLPSKADRQHRDSSSGTTPTSSLSFLQRLSSFHTSHSPTNPQNLMEEGGNRPVDPLLFPPLREIDALESIEENTIRHPTQPDEIWSEPTTSRHPVKSDSEEDYSPPVEITRSPPITTERFSPFKKNAMDKAAHEREQVQKALETCLENFREGKMRSLTDDQVSKLRTMHENQRRLTELHKRVMKIDDPLKDDPEVNERYEEIAKQLNELHEQMDEFSTMASVESPFTDVEFIPIDKIFHELI